MLSVYSKLCAQWSQKYSNCAGAVEMMKVLSYARSWETYWKPPSSFVMTVIFKALWMQKFASYLAMRERTSDWAGLYFFPSQIFTFLYFSFVSGNSLFYTQPSPILNLLLFSYPFLCSPPSLGLSCISLFIFLVSLTYLSIYSLIHKIYIKCSWEQENVLGNRNKLMNNAYLPLALETSFFTVESGAEMIFLMES